MKIKIDDNGLTIDGQKYEVTQLTAEYLDQILDKAIKQEVEFILENDNDPLYSFFSTLKIDTAPGSEFLKALDELEEELKVDKDEDILDEE